MPDQDEAHDTGHDYSAAYRLPHMVPDLGGWRPPWGTWTVVQYVPALVILPLALGYWHVWLRWAASFGDPAITIGIALVILAGAPLGLGYLIGYLTFDGRSPARAAYATARGTVEAAQRSATPTPRLTVRGSDAIVTAVPLVVITNSYDDQPRTRSTIFTIGRRHP